MHSNSFHLAVIPTGTSVCGALDCGLISVVGSLGQRKTNSYLYLQIQVLVLCLALVVTQISFEILSLKCLNVKFEQYGFFLLI